MKRLSEFILEQQDIVYAVADADLDDAMLSVWDNKEDAETEIKDRQKENKDVNLHIIIVKRSEIQK